MDLLNNVDVQGYMLIAFGLGFFLERFMTVNKEALKTIKFRI